MSTPTESDRNKAERISHELYFPDCPVDLSDHGHDFVEDWSKANSHARWQNIDIIAQALANAREAGEIKLDTLIKRNRTVEMHAYVAETLLNEALDYVDTSKSGATQWLVKVQEYARMIKEHTGENVLTPTEGDK